MLSEIYTLIILLCLCAIAQARTENDQVASDLYAPFRTECASTDLVREAQSFVSNGEKNYISARKRKADEALRLWLKHHGHFEPSVLPTLALASSGGGFRALLNAAGVMQALDGRDSNGPVRGIYQALSYQAGLSGSSFFMSSLAVHNWPTISTLRDKIWSEGFSHSFLIPKYFLSIGLKKYNTAAIDIAAKENAGFRACMADSEGRTASYEVLGKSTKEVYARLTTLKEFDNFTTHNVPYPIITALGIDPTSGNCYPEAPPLQFEFHPYEYGSWDAGIAAFADPAYMGSVLRNGKPRTSNDCIQGYDRLSYIMATSGNVWNSFCDSIPHSNDTTAGMLSGLLPHAATFDDIFASYPNPFFGLASASKVAQNRTLYMVDGGWAHQNNPIWPFIQDARSIDVLLVNDNSDETEDHFPNGNNIYQTYLNAQAAGLTGMPRIPDSQTFVTEGLNKRAVFFGCPSLGSARPRYEAAEHNEILIVYLPNVDYEFPSNQPTYRFDYSPKDTAAMIANGNLVAEQNGVEDWGICLACALLKGNVGSKMLETCEACFDKWCF